jgi:hypothetical protein
VTIERIPFKKVEEEEKEDVEEEGTVVVRAQAGAGEECDGDDPKMILVA